MMPGYVPTRRCSAGSSNANLSGKGCYSRARSRRSRRSSHRPSRSRRSRRSRTNSSVIGIKKGAAAANSRTSTNLSIFVPQPTTIICTPCRRAFTRRARLNHDIEYDDMPIALQCLHQGRRAFTRQSGSNHNVGHGKPVVFQSLHQSGGVSNVQAQYHVDF